MSMERLSDLELGSTPSLSGYWTCCRFLQILETSLFDRVLFFPSLLSALVGPGLGSIALVVFFGGFCSDCVEVWSIPGLVDIGSFLWIGGVLLLST